MIKNKLVNLFMFLIAISIQLSMVPLIGEKFFMINSLFCLSIIFSLKETRIRSIIWGAFLGGLSDLLLFQHIGYNGIAFVVASYFLGFFSHKMVISGILPITLVSIISFIVFVFVCVFFLCFFFCCFFVFVVFFVFFFIFFFFFLLFFFFVLFGCLYFSFFDVTFSRSY